MVFGINVGGWRYMCPKHQFWRRVFAFLFGEVKKRCSSPYRGKPHVLRGAVTNVSCSLAAPALYNRVTRTPTRGVS